MTYEGHVKNGTVVLNESVRPPQVYTLLDAQSVTMDDSEGRDSEN